MNKYKKLLSDTVIYGFGTFSSKLLVFFLTRLYTECLTSSEYGQADLITNIANLLIPLAAAGMCDGIFRFTLDRDRDKNAVFSTGVIISAVSCGAFLLLSPMLLFFEYFRNYAWVIVLYVICSNFHSVCAQYIRALDKTKLFAFQGILNTVLTILFNLLFLVALPKNSFLNGVYGYVLSIVIADLIVGCFLFVYAKLWKCLNVRYIKADLVRLMLKYSLPLIPTTIFWWITNVSDRYMITFLVNDVGEAVTGLYTAAYKIPTLLMLVTGVFAEAWQISAVHEYDNNDRAIFYSSVFSSFQSVIFICASFIVAFSRFFAKILFADSYYTAWEFIPILVLAAVFSSFVNFLSSVYMVKKNSVKSFITSMIGALINITLNLILIPNSILIANTLIPLPGLGAQGAALATVISYLTVLCIRLTDVRKLLNFDVHIVKLIVNCLILTFGCISMIFIRNNNLLLVLSQLIFVSFIVVINFKSIIKIIKTAINSFIFKSKQ